MLRASLNYLGILVFGAFVAACTTQHKVGKEPGESHARPAEPAPAPRPLPAGSADGVSEHLLHEYAERSPIPIEEIGTWQLPFQAKRIAVAMLILAVKDDVSGLPHILTRHARWGLPDRREFDARPILADGGYEFLDALREAASRFARKEAFYCPPIVPPAAQTYVRNGAEPMWCAYLGQNGRDVLAFKFVYEAGAAKIDYVGLWRTLPTGPLYPRPGFARQQPPMIPLVKPRPGSGGPLMPAGDAIPFERRQPPPRDVPLAPAPEPTPAGDAH